MPYSLSTLGIQRIQCVGNRYILGAENDYYQLVDSNLILWNRNVMKVMDSHLQTLREELLRGHRIEDLAYAVHYEPDGQKRLQIEQDLCQYFKPPCGCDDAPHHHFQ
jgi:hypothetical protein